MRKAFLLLLAVTVSVWTVQAQSAASYVSRNIAGAFPLGDGGPATSALLEAPQAVAADSNGTLYIADAGNGVIRRVLRGVITSVAGYSGYIYDLKLDSAGNLYVAGGNYAYKITPAGKVSIVAGNGSTGTFTGDGGPATSAGFYGIYALAIDSSNNLYLCDANNNRIRKVTPDGIVQTIAGGNGKGSVGDNGPATSALLNYPRHLAVDAGGNVYVNDYNNNRVRKISLDGIIKTIAGSGVCCASPDGGLASNAFLYTGPVTTDPSGNVYIFDFFSNRIRRVSPDGILQTYAGDGKEGFAGDGDSATLARFSGVAGLGTDSLNNLYIVDSNNERIRVVSTGGGITTIAGRSHFNGEGGPATAALLHRPQGVVQTADGTIYFTDTANHRVRKIAPDGKISTIAGTGDPGYSGEGSPATQANLYFPDALAIDGAGNLFVVDQNQLRVRKINAAGVISLVAGNGRAAYSVDGSGALLSGFGYIAGIAVDSAGNVYVSEQVANRIKKITPAGGMSTYAGAAVNGDTSGLGFGGDGQSAGQAVFAYPGPLALDSAGNLYIADTLNFRIRRVSPAAGTVTTIAGTGKCCYAGDGAKATAAQVSPSGMAADANGGLWITDSLGIRYIGADGNINRIAGGTGFGFGGDDFSANANTRYNYPTGIALNSAGEVIVADTSNSRIRKLQPNDPTRMDIVSGNNQTGTTGIALNAFIVKLTGKAGLPPAGVPVTFVVTAGSADLSLKTASTDISGQSGIAATPTKAGSLTVTATAGAFSAVFTATITDPVVTPPPPPADLPVISPGGIGQNGFSVPAVQTVSTGAITTIYGSNFMAAGSAPQVNTVSGGTLATKFAAICVTFGGVKAPIFAVAATQITVAVPAVAAGTVAVQVLRNCGDAGELKSNILTATAASASPEFLYLSTAADGKNPVAAVTTDGLFVAAPGSIPGANLRAAKSGDILVVYALGLGATDPAQAVGVPAAGIASVTLPVGITIGGVPLAASDILYAGVSPSFIGLYQVNLRVPAGIASGNQPMVIQIGSNQSPTGGYLTIQ
jgi:uncharacterized protein (TIGR03437 family)